SASLWRIGFQKAEIARVRLEGVNFGAGLHHALSQRCVPADVGAEINEHVEVWQEPLDQQRFERLPSAGLGNVAGDMVIDARGMDLERIRLKAVEAGRGLFGFRFSGEEVEDAHAPCPLATPTSGRLSNRMSSGRTGRGV